MTERELCFWLDGFLDALPGGHALVPEQVDAVRAKVAAALGRPRPDAAAPPSAFRLPLRPDPPDPHPVRPKLYDDAHYSD